MTIRPPRLQPGDTIGIIAPASAPPDPRNIDRGVAALEALGFKVKLAPNVRKRWGFLAGSDRERAGDLMRMFTDRKVNAIVCGRGGYGAARLLPLLDYGVIRANARISACWCPSLASAHPRRSAGGCISVLSAWWKAE
jgi:muramoyltetrapeptide carboxypeptidase